MHAVTKGQALAKPVAVSTDWNVFAAPIEADSVEKGASLKELQAALRQSEIVIRAQEERIRKLESLALTDELTRLANRRGFMATFERELALARRDTSYGGVLVMIDLDGFKEINDKWGHPAGDAYLCAVAQALRQELRVTDTVARLGGDEFVLLLTHMDEDVGAKRVAKLEQALRTRTVLGEKLPIRASFGFAAYTGASRAEAVVQAADLRLYANKPRASNRAVGA